MADFQGPGPTWSDEIVAKEREIRSGVQPSAIRIESDFISHIDGEMCRDVTCPCHAEREVEIHLSLHMVARYNRASRMLSVIERGRCRVFSAEETYRLLALLHAEMPAEGGE